MSESVAYKAYLGGESGAQSETRRFAVDKDVSSNFVYLQGKLAAVFPTLQGKLFTVTWKDADGDNVTVGGDEDLMIALTEMSEPVKKIVVTVKGEKPAADDKPVGEPHPGVTCDGCNANVVGFRYKCLLCPDYDLCARCEHKGLHPGHNMMRLASAQKIPLPMNFFKRLQKFQEKAEKRQKCKDKKEEEEKGESDEDCSFWWRGPPMGRGGFGPRGRGGCMRGRGMPHGGAHPFGGPHHPPFGGPHPPPFGGPNPPPFGCRGNPFEDMMKGWMGPEMFNNVFPGPSGEGSNKKDDAQKMQEAAQEAAKVAGKVATEAVKVASELAGKYLDGLGKQFEANGNEQNSGASAGENGQTDTKTADESETKNKTPNQKSGEGMADLGSSSKDEDWTMIKDTTEESTSNKEENQDPAAASVEIPIKESEPSAPSHPDPKIQVALEAMTSMGFKNEGGWLTTLLEAKNGDIAKVLDILQPVKK